MAARRRGPIAKTIEGLFIALHSGVITKTQFKEGIRKLREQGQPPLTVGLAFQRSGIKYFGAKVDDLWGLADEVDPKIGKDYERYKAEFLAVTGQPALGSEVACWHHGNENRLKKCLGDGYCDLHPLAKECPRKRMSAEDWFHNKMKLKIGDRVRFRVEGRRIVASGEIRSEPFTNPRPVDPHWPGAVLIGDVVWFQGGVCPSWPLRGSHRIPLKPYRSVAST